VEEQIIDEVEENSASVSNSKAMPPPINFPNRKKEEPIPIQTESIPTDLPTGFFDKEVMDTSEKITNEEPNAIINVQQLAPAVVVPQAMFINKKESEEEIEEPKPKIPQGFFDNPTADAKARGTKKPKPIDLNAEFEKLQAELKPELEQVEKQRAQEDEDAAVQKEMQEDEEQKSYQSRVEMLKLKKLELAQKRQKVQKKKKKEEMDVELDVSSDLKFDWRAKAVH